MSVETPSPAPKIALDAVLEKVRRAVASNQSVRQSLPGGGKLFIDRPVPFLCLYRRPADRADAGTDRLVTAEASHLVLSAERPAKAKADEKRLVHSLAQILSQQFGAFLLVDVWSTQASDEIEVVEDPLVPRPAVRIFASQGEDSSIVVDSLQHWLAKIVYQKQRLIVDIADPKAHPDRLRPLLSARDANELQCVRIGLEVKPHYRDAKTGAVFPPVLTRFRRGFSRALQHAFFEFARQQTPLRPRHYHSLGRRAMVKAVWEVDQRLADISRSFDFLLQLTPVNSGRLWSDFKKSGLEKAPLLRYRSPPIDPILAKRKLYSIPLDQVEDPALANLLREKQVELDRQLTMLMDRGTSKFMYGSLQLYGPIGDELLRHAETIIEENPAGAARSPKTVKLEQLVARAEEEIAHYRAIWDGFSAEVEIRPDMMSGLMCSQGNLLVSRDVRIPAARVEALIDHEIGTHLVTYYNGNAQRFKQLATGLAQYDTLQEGLAVLAEYLAGGLSRSRLRLLGGRVLVARAMVDGASFVEAFRRLRRYGFEKRTAFRATLRVFRGGGLTKDACYLKGLLSVLEYLKDGGELAPLFIGKIGVNHIPILKELQSRNVLTPPPIQPRHLSTPSALERLERLRGDVTVSKMAEPTA